MAATLSSQQAHQSVEGGRGAYPGKLRDRSALRLDRLGGEAAAECHVSSAGRFGGQSGPPPWLAASTLQVFATGVRSRRLLWEPETSLEFASGTLMGKRVLAQVA